MFIASIPGAIHAFHGGDPIDDQRQGFMLHRAQHGIEKIAMTLTLYGESDLADALGKGIYHDDRFGGCVRMRHHVHSFAIQTSL
jgi:hypothetical protein